MLKKIKGNIFNTSCQTLVNTVNCIGVMGKGIALECKLRFPPMFEKYKEYEPTIMTNEEIKRVKKFDEVVKEIVGL